jgi:colanic acid biosynthesis protein WcaH
MYKEQQIVELSNELRNLNIDAHNGLPEELFLLVSGIIPVPNVDLLITNSHNQILLSWRDDIYYGKGWHIPGGCMRYGETMQERVQKTALNEIGSTVIINGEPIAIRDAIREYRDGIEHPNERGHNVAILFDCSLPKNFAIDNRGKIETEAGYLKWFDKIPDNMLRIHDVYADKLKRWKD